MLWYLHLCADAGITVTAYCDRPIGEMTVTNDGGGKFTKVILKPEIKITADSNLEQSKKLHEKAHKLCFIANSVNSPVFCQASIALFFPEIALVKLITVVKINC